MSLLGIKLYEGPSGPELRGSSSLQFLGWDPVTATWRPAIPAGGGAVDSVFTRTGDVVAQTGDYNSNQVDNGSNVPGDSTSDALDNLLAGILAVVTESGVARSMAAADAGKLIDCTNALGCTLTVPKNATVALAIGTMFLSSQGGVGQVTWSPEDGTVTLLTSQTLKSLKRYAMTGVVKVGTNTWYAFGERELV